jgi:poly-beta-1,6-N-acetyl-D-glucosamine synthase
VNYLFILAFIIFLVSFSIQLYYTLVVHKLLWGYKNRDSESYIVNPVSVIVCARNEETNLSKNLACILDQDYPDFEVIVVNDCSVDNSEFLLRDLAAKYTHLKVVTINEHERFKHGKKFAVTLAIKAARNEFLLLTDADCRPNSNQWLRIMQSNFNGSAEIVLGYSPYEYLPGFVNKLIQFETFFTALNYLSFALAGKPYMGVGRNIAYTKSLFFKGKGFASHMHILSGDDDLFVNQNATTTNTCIEIHPAAQVWSEPKTTMGSYIKQKLRHLSAGVVYKKEHRKMLSLQAGSAILFYLSLSFLLFSPLKWWILLVFYIFRLVSQFVIYRPVFKKLSYEDLIWWLPVFDFIYYIYIFTLSIVSLFRKTIRWK